MAGSILRQTEKREDILVLFDQALAAVDKHPIVNTRTHDEFVPVERRRGEWESDLEMERRLDGVRIGRAPMNLDRAAIVRDRLSGMTLTAVSKKWAVSRSLVCKLVNRSRAGDDGSMLPPARIVDAAGVAPSSPAEARW
jgi:hypothetical protein